MTIDDEISRLIVGERLEVDAVTQTALEAAYQSARRQAHKEALEALLTENIQMVLPGAKVRLEIDP